MMWLSNLVRVFITPWQPEQESWRKVHVLAHLLGGVGLALGVRYAPFLEPAWQHSFAGRMVMVAVYQGLWEWVQYENWNLPTHPRSYPMWSALWDLTLVVSAALVVELAFKVLS